MKCCICKKEINKTEINNSEPLLNDACCSECNVRYVLPARIALLNDFKSRLNNKISCLYISDKEVKTFHKYKNYNDFYNKNFGFDSKDITKILKCNIINIDKIEKCDKLIFFNKSSSTINPLITHFISHFSKECENVKGECIIMRKEYFNDK